MTTELEAREGFREAYGLEPGVVVRAPGRVNLIGEHTDYSELPVLPIAIERSTFVAAGEAAAGMVVARSREFPGEARIVRGAWEAPEHPWHRYIAGAAEQLEETAPGRGASLFVASDLPSAGGLSSSSALTCGVLAALTAAWQEPLAQEDVVRLAVAAEHRAGVESGGMDQETILFAQAGAALRIDFRPPGRRLAPLPAGLHLVVASSGEEAPKGGAAKDAYNERVVGARMAATMLADELGIDLDSPPTLGQVAGVDVVDILVDGLPEKISPVEVAHGAQVDIARIVQLSHETFDTRQKLPVKRVARHVLSEAERVDDAEAALAVGELRAFGELLNASHNSLREDYRCSTPALDRLCAAMRKAGAYGARLTGAGFGGFALAVCPPEAVTAVITAAITATGGPAFEVHASAGLEWL